MFVLVDALSLQTGSRERGIGRYTSGLLGGLRTVRPDWDIQLIEHDRLPAPTQPTVAGLPRRTFRYPFKPVPENQTVLDLYFSDWVRAQGADWVLHPSPFEADGATPHYGVPGPRRAAVLYDLIPLVFREHYLDGQFDKARYADRLREAARMDLLLAISEATAADAIRLLGTKEDRVVNIRGASDPRFAPLPIDQRAASEQRVRTRYGLDRPFILYVGGDDWRKNLSGAMAGYAALPHALKAEYDLVLACHLPEEAVQTLLAKAERMGVAGRVKFTGFVPDADLIALYHACRVFFFPSQYEGLGLPVLEALACGASVVCSDNSSLPEYGGSAARYCDPTSPASMADALAAALAEPRDSRRIEGERFAAGFTWEATAERAARALENAPNAVARRRPRLAWVSPAPPAPTGIADYAAEVAAALADRFDLEWVFDPNGPAPDRDILTRYPSFNSADAEARHAAQPYDLFVYHLGNQHFHTYMLPLFRRHPGLVVLHDLNLDELVRHATNAGIWPNDLSDREDLVSPSDVFAETVGLLVHSRWAWQAIRPWTSAPTAIVPLIAAIPPLLASAHERARLGLPADRFLICTLGIVAPHKRIPAILEGMAALPEEIRGVATLLIVGDCSEADRESLTGLAAGLGIGQQVEFRGRVPLEDLPAYAVACDVCVQLRSPSHGESSAALARALAAGAACVTSDVATIAEIPDTAILKVRSPDHDVADLTAALTRLAREPELRVRLGANARRHMAAVHGPEVVAAGYAAVIADAMARSQAQDLPWRSRVLNAITDSPVKIPSDLIAKWAELRTSTAQAGERRPASYNL